MPFHENLSALRKSRGLSQDALAEKIQVSRQAVSKWECNDAAPDLPKLLALSEALDISLDSLCGTGFSAAADGPKEETRHFSGKQKAIFIFAVVLIAAVLFAGGFCIGTRFPAAVSDGVENGPSPLPDSFTVSGVSFSCDSSGYLSYVCTPSCIRPDLTYEITFTSSYYNPQTFQVTCEGGVCSGTLPRLKNTGVFSVTLVISNGTESRAVPIASGLSFTPGNVSWSPPQ